MLGAVGAAVEGAVGLDAMPDNLAAAVVAGRGQGVNRTLKTIEHVRLAGHNDLKSFVVNIATNFTRSCHLDFS
jgi:hypothetical protein